MELRLEKIDKWYPGPNAKNAVHALTEVSYTFTDGIYGLTGANGAGKSTLIQILTGNLPCSSGKILLNGKHVSPKSSSYKRIIGYMPQQQWIYEDMTCFQFMNYLGALKELPPKLRKEQVEDKLLRVNLCEKKFEKIGSLSGGMKQRLLLAQAMLGEPKILILDEPTAGVDPEERERIKEMILEYSNENITLISTHIMSDLKGIVKDTVRLEKGKIK